MAVPTTKAELLTAIVTSYDLLALDLARLPQGRSQECTLKGHAAGTWMSPADLVAYLIGWNELLLSWLARDDRGETVDFPETGYQWNQLGALAQKFYADHAALDWPSRLTKLQAAKACVLETVQARTDAELYGAAWYGKWTKGRMIQLNTASPYKNARGRIRKWLKSSPAFPEERAPKAPE